MAGIPAKTREYLEKTTDETNTKLNNVVSELVNTLETYGLKGIVKMQLTVSVNNSGTETVAERSCVVPYATWR